MDLTAEQAAVLKKESRVTVSLPPRPASRTAGCTSWPWTFSRATLANVQLRQAVLAFAINREKLLDDRFPRLPGSGRPPGAERALPGPHLGVPASG